MRLINAALTDTGSGHPASLYAMCLFMHACLLCFWPNRQFFKNLVSHTIFTIFVLYDRY
jgi:hypothetical protein